LSIEAKKADVVRHPQVLPPHRLTY